MKSSTRPTSVPAGFSTGLRRSCVIISRRLSRCLSLMELFPFPQVVGPIISPVFERLTSLRNEPDEQRQSSYVLNPPPAGDHAECETEQGHPGQERAADRFSNVGTQRRAVDHAIGLALEVSEQRHQHDGGGADRDAGDRTFWHDPQS